MTSTPLRLRTTDLEWRAVEGEVVMLDLREQRYQAVNRSGALLWPALAGGTDREQMTGCLVQQYGIDWQRAAQDVDALLDELREAGILEEGHSGEED